MDEQDISDRPVYGRAGFAAPHAWLSHFGFSPQDLLPFGEDLRLTDGTLQARLRSPLGEEVGWLSLCCDRTGHPRWRHTHHQRRGVFRSPGSRPEQIVLTTSIIDAIAFAAVNPPAADTVILACNGAWCPLAAETVIALASSRLDVVHIASGFDAAGFDLQFQGQYILDRLPDSLTYSLFAVPRGKSWLQDLRQARGHDWHTA